MTHDFIVIFKHNSALTKVDGQKDRQLLYRALPRNVGGAKKIYFVSHLHKEI